MLQAYEGYLESGQFVPIGQPVRLKGRRRVIVTILDDVLPEQAEQMEDAKLKEFNDIMSLITSAADEDMPPVEPMKLREVTV